MLSRTGDTEREREIERDRESGGICPELAWVRKPVWDIRIFNSQKIFILV